MKPRVGFTQVGDSVFQVPIENIWSRVRRWARRNGYEYDGSYGVVGVAPT